MKNALLLVGVIGLGAGAWFIYQYMYKPLPAGGTDRTDLIFGGVFLLVALICFAFFFFMKFREEGDQDISITKF
jgi:hypothetical protein